MHYSPTFRQRQGLHMPVPHHTCVQQSCCSNHAPSHLTQIVAFYLRLSQERSEGVAECVWQCRMLSGNAAVELHSAPVSPSQDKAIVVRTEVKKERLALYLGKSFPVRH